MYEEFYGFSRRPFSLLPDPGLMYLSKAHRAALDALQRAVKQKKRVCLMTGEIGAGKTTLKLKLREALGDALSVGHIPNANDAFDERPSWILRAFGLDADAGDGDQLFQSLITFLRQQKKRRKRTVLLIDEAQGSPSQPSKRCITSHRWRGENTSLFSSSCLGRSKCATPSQIPISSSLCAASASTTTSTLWITRKHVP
jgi:hypothetical protein